MPSYATLMRWTKDNKKMRDEILAARETRAIHFEEQAIRVGSAAEGLNKDDVPGHRLAFDTYTWAAEKADPSRFGKRTTIGGDPNNPIRIVVQTGVPDPSPHQLPPELQADGTVKTVECEVQDAQSSPASSSNPPTQEAAT